jgi:cytochrome c biogenesis protein CcmG, thiol:disulfide interchange protein DsbE
VTRRLKTTAQLVALACVAGLLALLVWSVVHQQHAPSVGSLAPAFTLSRLGRPGKVSLASYRGKPVVLNFWASWCIPCKSEAAVLEQQWQRYRSQGVVFLGIDYNDVSSDARKFLERHGVTYPTLLDGSGAIGDRYGLSGVPETYFIDRTGHIVGEHILGPITNATWKAAFDRGIKAALGS